MTTFGQLISDLYTQYERRYHDPELAAVATEVTVEELLRQRRRATKRAHPVTARGRKAA